MVTIIAGAYYCRDRIGCWVIAGGASIFLLVYRNFVKALLGAGGGEDFRGDLDLDC